MVSSLLSLVIDRRSIELVGTQQRLIRDTTGYNANTDTTECIQSRDALDPRDVTDDVHTCGAVPAYSIPVQPQRTPSITAALSCFLVAADDINPPEVQAHKERSSDGVPKRDGQQALPEESAYA